MTGEGVTDESGEVDRRKLGAIVFGDKVRELVLHVTQGEEEWELFLSYRRS